MKRSLWLVACLLACLLLSPATALAADKTITLPDANLFVAVTEQLDAKNVSYARGSAANSLVLSDEALASVTELDVSRAGIASLEGVQGFSALTKLVARSNGLTLQGAYPVGQLTKLTYLDISHSQMADPEGKPDESITAHLVGLAQLKYLDISHSQVRYTTGLYRLAQLEHVDLFDNLVHDLSGLCDWSGTTPINTLASLNYLSLGENNEETKCAWKGLEALKVLTSLTHLDFSCNQSPEVVPLLGDLTKLEYLQLQRNGIEDVSPLSALTKLRTLILGYNNVRGVKALHGLTQLEELNLHGNLLSSTKDASEGVDTSGLVGVFGNDAQGDLVWPKLRVLDVAGNYEWSFRTAELGRLFDMDQASADDFELRYRYDNLFKEATGYDAHATRNTKLSDLPHRDGDIAYVTYDDFGARAKEGYDDWNAMYNAHYYANKYGYEVRAIPGKTYHIYREWDLDYTFVQTNIDWQGAHFVVHDEHIEDKRSRFTPLLCWRGGPGENVDGDDSTYVSAYSQIVTMPDAKKDVPAPDISVTRTTTKLEGTAFLAQLQALAAKGYEKFFVAAYNEGKRQYIRFGSNGNSGSVQWDGLIVDAEGKLVTKASDPYYNRPQWDFDQVTKVVITPIPRERAYIKNGTFTVNTFADEAEVTYHRSGKSNIYLYRHIQVRDCANVLISGIVQHVEDHDRLSGSYYGFVEARDGACFRIENSDFFAHKFCGSGRSTYGLIINRISDVEVDNVICNGITKEIANGITKGTAGSSPLLDSNRWGVTGNNHCKDITYTNCVLNRIDAHEGYYNLKAYDCVLGCHAFRLTGQGPFDIRRTTAMAENFISLRSDYGSTWDTWDSVGRIVDCKLVYWGRWSQNLVAVTGSFDGNNPLTPHDFGYDLRFPNLYVQNFTVDESLYNPANDRETFCVIPNSKYGTNYTYALPSAYWPTNVTLNGLTLTGYDQTMGHVPYFSLVDTKEGGIVDPAAERNYLVSGVTVKVAEAAADVASQGTDVTEKLLCDHASQGTSARFEGAVWVRIDNAAIVANKQGDVVTRRATVQKDGRPIAVQNAADGTPWEQTLIEPGTYTVTLFSTDGVGGWTGKRSFSFVIAGEREVAERLLYTRPDVLSQSGTAGTAKRTGYVSLAQAEMADKEVQVTYTGDDPVLRVYQRGTGTKGTTGTLFLATVTPTRVEELPGGAKRAHFSSATIDAAWQSPVAYDDAREGDTVKLAPGAYNRMEVSVAGDNTCTLQRVALVGGDEPSHPGKLVSVSGKTADQIIQDMGIGWNLGDTLESVVAFTVDGKTTNAPSLKVDWNLQPTNELYCADIETETWRGNPRATYELFKFLKSQGYNAVRIPVTWFQHLYDDGKDANDPTSRHHIDEAWMARVHEVVDYAYDLGMYAIVNTHHEKYWLETAQFGDEAARPAMKEKLSAVWKQIATEFADYDQRVIFDGLNEPRASGEGISDSREWGSPTEGDIQTLNELHQAFRDAVRSVASPYQDTRLLLCATMGAGTRLHHTSQLKVPTKSDGTADPYVAVSVHAYEPYAFSRAKEEWRDATWSVKNQVELERVLYGLYANFVSKGTPVVIGEFNAQDFDNTAEREKWAKAYLSLARGYGMACLQWDSGDDEEDLTLAGYRAAYVDRFADQPAWANDNQRAVAQATIAAAHDTSVGWRSACDAQVPEGVTMGRQVNSAAFALEADGRTYWSARWADVVAGDVAVEFSGSFGVRAPELVLNDAAGKSWMSIAPSYVAWNQGATGGVAYWWPKHLERLWCAATVDGVPNTGDKLAKLGVRATTSMSVSKVVLQGLEPAPDVSDGKYGDYSTRLMLSRPDVQLDRPGASDTAYRSLGIDLRAPHLKGEWVAIRYRGDKPSIQLTTADWKKSMWYAPTTDVVVPDRDDEHVALFKWPDVMEAWQSRHGTDSTPDYLRAALPSGTQDSPTSCTVHEVVELGVPGTDHLSLLEGTPLMSDKAKPGGTLYLMSDSKVLLSPFTDDAKQAAIWDPNTSGVICAAIAQKEIAVAFTGDIPYLFPCTTNYQGWPSIDAYEVVGDPSTGAVAYYPAEQIMSAWGDRTYQESADAVPVPMTPELMARIYVTTRGDTTVTDARLLGRHTHTWGDWAVTTSPTCTKPGEKRRTCTENALHVERTFVAALGHEWGEATYEWSADGKTVTATHACTRAGCDGGEGGAAASESEAAQVTETLDPAPSCTEPGSAKRSATFENVAFAPQEQRVDLPALGHDWGSPTYAWTDDDQRVEAVCACTRCVERRTETATVTRTVTSAASVDAKGTAHLVANFTAEPFSTQEKDVATPRLTELHVTASNVFVGQAPEPVASWSRTGTADVVLEYKLRGSSDETYAKDVPTAVGAYTVRASAAPTADYEGATATADFSIVDGSGVAASGYEGGYDGAAHGIVVSVPDGAMVAYRAGHEAEWTIDSPSDWMAESPQYADAGTYVVSYKVTLPEVGDVVGTRTVAIGKAPLVVRANDVALVYGDEPTNAGVSYRGFVGGQSDQTEGLLSGALAFGYQGYAAGDPVGTYPASIVLGDSMLQAANYAISYEPGGITVGSKTLGIRWPDESARTFTYDGSTHTVVAQATGVRTGDDVAFAYQDNEAEHVASRTARVTGLVGADAKNYVLADDAARTCAWEIRRAANKAEVSLEGWGYGSPANEPQVRATFGADTATVEYGDAPDGTFVQDVPTAAGTHYVRARIEGTTDYEGAVSPATAFVISRATPDLGKVVARDSVSRLVPADVTLVREKTSLAGTLALVDGTLLCGTHDYTWRFVPDDANYATVEGKVQVVANAHTWGKPVYEPSEDLSRVTATRTCTNTGCNAGPDGGAARETETADTTLVVTKEATATEEGAAKRTATFENTAFGTWTSSDLALPRLASRDADSKADKDVRGVHAIEHEGNWQNAQLAMDEAALAKAIPHDEDERVETWVEVRAVEDAEVSETERKAAQEVLGANLLGTWFDASLFKRIGTGGAERLSVCSAGVTVAVTVPDALVPPAGVRRTFSVLRVHEGKAALLSASYDVNTRRLTFSSDLFSLYAIVYQDEAESTQPPLRKDSGDGASTAAGTRAATATRQRTGRAAQASGPAQSLARTGDSQPAPLVWLLLALLAWGGGRALRARR